MMQAEKNSIQIAFSKITFMKKQAYLIVLQKTFCGEKCENEDHLL